MANQTIHVVVRRDSRGRPIGSFPARVRQRTKRGVWTTDGWFIPSGQISAAAAQAIRPRAIGAKMRQAVEYVRNHPGCSKYEVSKAVGARHMVAYGWPVVRRCIEAGLIEATQEGGRWSLTVADR